MNNKRLQILFSKNNDGTLQQWEIFVQKNVIITKFGRVGGQIQETKDEIKEGKNIGRSNQTTAEDQANKEAQSRWEKKLKSKYVKTQEEALNGNVDIDFVEGGLSPMLAHKFRDHGEKITYSCYGQPKLDGTRTIAMINNGKCSLWSRTRKPITGVPHIIDKLEISLPKQDLVLDGELYCHKLKQSFEEIVSFVRCKEPKPGHEIIEYHVYDLIDDNLTFKERTEKIQNIRFASNKIVKVETRLVNNVEELMDYFNVCRNAGYEGCMARNSQSLYKHARSYDLQKIKEMDDSEYEIVGVEAGRGRMAECGIFVCKTRSGNQFNCKSEGSLDLLKKYLSNPESVIGKMLTVRYQGLTNGGVPRFPIGVCVRDYE